MHLWYDENCGKTYELTELNRHYAGSTQPQAKERAEISFVVMCPFGHMKARGTLNGPAEKINALKDTVVKETN